MASMENVAKGVRTFDAFPKVSSTYTTRSSQGGVVTIVLSIICIFLIWTEMGSYFAGVEEQQFAVDSSIGWDMQVNVDITVAMPCVMLHVNVQDTSGDRLLAAELLEMEGTEFDLASTHELTIESRADADDDLHSVFSRAKVAKKFRKTKKSHPNAPACRIYGSFKLNKVQGDLHITAKNYGYMDDSRSHAHVTPGSLNFSHVMDEFSFGDYYPKLENPLDGVAALINTNFFRYQYYLSIVPTMYVGYGGRNVVFTNQYAVTEQPTTQVNPSHPPGIFFKYDIEPIGLTITERRVPFWQFLVRLVNVVGGIVICTGWLYPLIDSMWDKWANRGRSVPHENQTLLDKGLKRDD
ncbi:endoplasmic reticulum vesicle transporter-domain-containing protein [Lipomyces orientalis]|uniref:Endoplasmic reticulum vesicle transporter-domain-containing protein n=1 Tax=Lipomyces orientalis TaxID=1233043 RepID=A0ACC3TUZ0_9ASCO